MMIIIVKNKIILYVYYKRVACSICEQCRACGGTAGSSCALGFGVCCIVVKTACGSTVTANGTYITGPGNNNAQVNKKTSLSPNLRSNNSSVLLTLQSRDSSVLLTLRSRDSSVLLTLQSRVSSVLLTLRSRDSSVLLTLRSRDS